jgi:hypothetical protein
MVTFKMNVDLKTDKLKKLTEKIAEEALNDISDDLSATASAASPVDKGILQGEYEVLRHKTGNEISREVIFSVEEAEFNYAEFVHNTHPRGGIGEETRNKPPAQSGITKKSFPAGGFFLKGPLDQNRQDYVKYMDEKIKKDLESRG